MKCHISMSLYLVVLVTTELHKQFYNERFKKKCNIIVVDLHGYASIGIWTQYKQ